MPEKHRLKFRGFINIPDHRRTTAGTCKINIVDTISKHGETRKFKSVDEMVSYLKEEHHEVNAQVNRPQKQKTRKPKTIKPPIREVPKRSRMIRIKSSE